jgi:predicted glycogen debranching enzyme
MTSKRARGRVDAAILQDPRESSRREWLEPDGLGGFASGTLSGVRTSRYHALLLAAMQPPTERRVLVNGLEEEIVCEHDRFPLSSQRYRPDIVHPQGFRNMTSFELYPWPRWEFTFPLARGAKAVVAKEIFVPRGQSITVIRWTLFSGSPSLLRIRPLLSGRDYHGLQTAGEIDTRFQSSRHGVSWRPHAAIPAIHAGHNGRYHHDPNWYWSFAYGIEEHRGLEAHEDLWSPGEITFSLAPGSPAVLILSTDAIGAPAERAAEKLGAGERARRARLKKPATWEAELERNSDAFLVRRGAGRTIVAGYPWFTDWGRDTFISMRGLCLATGRLDMARGILLEWAKTVDMGMLPNRFADEGDQAEYNSVDASLWFVNVAGEFLAKTKNKDLKILWPAMSAIMRGYHDGTRYGIRVDADGLVRAGEPGSQLTWMDAKFESECFTPRIGKPVEIQALWLNALKTMSALEPKAAPIFKSPRSAKGAKRAAPLSLDWEKLFRRGAISFRKRFWNPKTSCLFDVVDGPSGDEAAIRPNQLFAVSLPAALLPAARARAVVDAAEKHLLTPIGLRTLAPKDPGYIGRYKGGRRERDAAYHNGTVWPWLLGPFVEAWVRVRKNSKKAKTDARRFLAALDAHMESWCLGSVAEVADGDAPHNPGGCPAQAWSVAEPLRLMKDVLQ